LIWGESLGLWATPSGSSRDKREIAEGSLPPAAELTSPEAVSMMMMMVVVVVVVMMVVVVMVVVVVVRRRKRKMKKKEEEEEEVEEVMSSTPQLLLSNSCFQETSMSDIKPKPMRHPALQTE
jgi:heme/copper-type cytochrome/quinol oxidase subunit 2